MTVSADIINCYILPGRVADARQGLQQAAAAEAIGVRGVFLSERWESKELGATMGALSQVTQRVQLIAGLTHFGTRHPLVLAGLAATMQTLSGNRFELGIGRSVPAMFKRLGIPTFTNEVMGDYADILRRLWAGEIVSYDGPIGHFPDMRLARPCDAPPPVLIGATGPKALALAGARFDGVVLHPFLTAEGVRRSIDIVRSTAADAGRDPAKIKVYATVVTSLDTLSPAERADKIEARAVSYFMHPMIGKALAEMNGWDLGPIDRLAATGISEQDFAKGGAEGSRQAMARVADILPCEWFDEGTIIADPATCVSRFGEYRAAGADELLLHGTEEVHLKAILAAMAEAQG